MLLQPERWSPIWQSFPVNEIQAPGRAPESAAKNQRFYVLIPFMYSGTPAAAGGRARRALTSQGGSAILVVGEQGFMREASELLVVVGKA